MTKKILLLESNPIARDFYHTQLKKAGHHVKTGTLHTQALLDWHNALRNGEPFDLIITDLMNEPKLGAPAADEPDGIVFVRELRDLEAAILKKPEYAKQPRVKIIAHTSAATMYRARCLEAGFDEVVKKNGNPARFLHQIQTIISS